MSRTSIFSDEEFEVEIGMQAVTELTGLQLILMKNRDIEEEYGVKENPDLRIELLDRYLQEKNIKRSREGILTETYETS